MTGKTRNIGILTVSTDLLAQLLHFPEGHTVTAVRQQDDKPYQFDVLVEGPSLRAVLPCQSTPRVDFTVTQHETDEMVPRREFVGVFTERHPAPAVNSTIYKIKDEDSA